MDINHKKRNRSRKDAAKKFTCGFCKAQTRSRVPAENKSDIQSHILRLHQGEYLKVGDKKFLPNEIAEMIEILHQLGFF